MDAPGKPLGGWCAVLVKLNGAPLEIIATPGTWAVIDRAWKSGDTVEIQIPLVWRLLPVDKQHPDRVAAMRGPTAMVMEGLWQETEFTLPDGDGEFEKMVSGQGSAQQHKSFEVPSVLHRGRTHGVLYVFRQKVAAGGDVVVIKNSAEAPGNKLFPGKQSESRPARMSLIRRTIQVFLLSFFGKAR